LVCDVQLSSSNIRSAIMKSQQHYGPDAAPTERNLSAWDSVTLVLRTAAPRSLNEPVPDEDEAVTRRIRRQDVDVPIDEDESERDTKPLIPAARRHCGRQD